MVPEGCLYITREELTGAGRYGRRLIIAYQQFKQADDYIQSQVLTIQAIWHQTSVQISFLQRIAGKLELEHCRIQVEVLSRLKGHLETAVATIERVTTPGPEAAVKKWKLMFLREALDKTVGELKEWQRMFDPTWYLIFLVSDKLID